MVLIRGQEYTAQNYSDRDLLQLGELFTRYSQLASGQTPSSTIGKAQENREIERMMADLLERIYPELATNYVVGGAIALHLGEIGAIIADLKDAVTSDPHITDGLEALGLSSERKAQYLADLKGAIASQVMPVQPEQPAQLDVAAVSEIVLAVMRNPELAKALQSK